MKKLASRKLLFRTVSLILCMTMMVFVASPVFAASKEGKVINNGKDINGWTVSDYKSWLKEQIDINPEAQETLKQFNELSVKEQKQFVEYLFDPEVQEEIFNAFNNVSDKERLDSTIMILLCIQKKNLVLKLVFQR